jgi:hypothetical protein
MGELGCIFWLIYFCILAYALNYPLIALIMIVVPISIYIYKKYYSEEGKKATKEKRLEKEKRSNRQELTQLLINFISENGGLKKFEAYLSNGYVENMELTNVADEQIVFSLNEYGYSKTDIYTICNIFDKLSNKFGGEVVRKYTAYKATGVAAMSYAMYGDGGEILTGIILYSKEERKRLQKEDADKRDKERYGDYKRL